MIVSKKYVIVALLTVPFGVQILFSSLVLDLENQASVNLRTVEKARKIVEKLNDVKVDLHSMITVKGETAASSPEQMPETLKKWYENINQDFNGLENACDEQVDLRVQIQKMQDEVKKCVMVAGTVQNSFFESVEKQKDAKARSWKDIRHFANDLVDADFQAFDNRMQKQADSSALLQVQLKDRQKQYLIATVVLDLLWALLTGFYVLREPAVKMPEDLA
jgi:archaellum component FlaC